jgi:hypothetical protein
MPRRTRLKPWRGDRWNSCVYNAIERRVAQNIEAIGAPLGIDDPTEQAALIEAVTIELRRAWSYLRDVQHAASNQAARHILLELMKTTNLVDAVERADPNVRLLIEKSDSEQQFLEVLVNDPPRLAKAVGRALRIVTKDRARGNPKGSIQFAEHILANSLAKVFQRFGGRPTRKFDPYEDKEYGQFRDFVIAVMEVIPKFLQRSPGRRLSSTSPVDYMVRLATRRLRGTPQKTA